MSRRRRRGSSPPFVQLQFELLNSQAYKDLSPSAGKALPYFLAKYKGFYKERERDVYEFCFSYKEAERYGFSPATFSRIIQELVDKGFIDPTWKGGLRSDGKSANKFRLSRRWLLYKRESFVKINWKQFAK